MKWRLLLLSVLFSLIAFAQSLLHTNVTISIREGRVEQFLNELSQRSGVQLSYSAGVVDLQKRTFITGNEKTVGEILRAVLRGQDVSPVEGEGKIFLVAHQPVKKRFTISGFITDKKSGERLIGASVYIPEKGLGTTSNVYGFYSITLEEDSLRFQVSYSGYIPFNATIHLRQNIDLNLEMDQAVVVNQVVVVNSEGKRNSATRAVGKNDVSSSFIKSLPALMGEADVFKSLQMLPGVQAGNEGSSGLNVRGGSPDQNLILIDGVPVYNASHAFGLFSIFNADAVNTVEIIKSGFPASYGGRLSSVVDVHMKEGDKYRYHGEGGIGLVFSKLTLEGPIKKGRSSFLVSTRRTYFDLIFKPLLRAVDPKTEFVPFFSDVNAKANFPLGKRGRVYFSFYNGKDNYYASNEQESNPDTVYIKSKITQAFSWGNITGLVRINQVINNKTFANLTMTYTRFRFRDKFINEQESNYLKYSFLSDQRYFSGIEDVNLKLDIDYLPHPDHFIKTGFSSVLHYYQPGISSFLQRDTTIRVNTEVNNNSVKGFENDLYIEDDIRVNSRLKLNAGLRFGSILIESHFRASLQPRLNAVYKLKEKWSLKASAGTMRQFIHLLANSNLGLPTDLWLPVTDRVPPQKSLQLTFGTIYRYDRSLEASMEVYYKQMKNVIDYSEGSSFGNAFNNWEDMVEMGRGKAYGIEWLVQKRKGAITGLLSYTLGKSTRQFQTINDGKTFPYKYDRRHEIKTAVIWKPSEKIELGANWVFSTGNAISIPVAYYYDPFTSRDVDIYTGRNNYRMPNYHRLDLSLRLTKQKRHHQRIWTFGVYNAYNRFNPFFIYKSEDLAGYSSTIEFKEMSIFPLLPSFSYQFKF